MSRHTLKLSEERSLHLYQEGAGSDIVLIHGAITTGHDWLNSAVYEALIAIARVTVIDRPGHGLSRRPRFGGTPGEQADQIAEGLLEIGVHRTVIVGHSFGALVSLALAERHPKLVTQLVLVAPLAFPEPRLLEHMVLAPRALPIIGPLFAQFAELTRIDRPALDLLHQVMFSPDTPPTGWKDSYPYELILTADAMVAEGEDAASTLPMSPASLIDMRQIKVRSHVLTGTADRVVEDERQGKALARQLPNGSVTELENAGHMLHHTHSDHVVAAVRAAMAADRVTTS